MYHEGRKQKGKKNSERVSVGTNRTTESRAEIRLE